MFQLASLNTNQDLYFSAGLLGAIELVIKCQLLDSFF